MRLTKSPTLYVAVTRARQSLPLLPCLDGFPVKMMSVFRPDAD